MLERVTFFNLFCSVMFTFEVLPLVCFLLKVLYWSQLIVSICEVNY